MTTDTTWLLSHLTQEQLDEIVADVAHDAILIDHHAAKQFRNPEDRLRFRSDVRAIVGERKVNQ
jgi:hypothetical protein